MSPEQIRKKIKKQYEDKITQLEEDNRVLRKIILEQYEYVKRLETENSQLQYKIDQIYGNSETDGLIGSILNLSECLKYGGV